MTKSKKKMAFGGVARRHRNENVAASIIWRKWRNNVAKMSAATEMKWRRQRHGGDSESVAWHEKQYQLAWHQRHEKSAKKKKIISGSVNNVKDSWRRHGVRQAMKANINSSACRARPRYRNKRNIGERFWQATTARRRGVAAYWWRHIRRRTGRT
jgi:hypothetical protein